MEIGYHEFPSGKKYTFIKQNGNPVFVRNICFLMKENDPYHIVVVREWGSPSNYQVWEPPKGQMEWKELADAGYKAGDVIKPNVLLKQMKVALTREIIEEAKITSMTNLRPLPLVYKQAWPESSVKNAMFMYQFWTANITEEALIAAQQDMRQLVRSPDLKDVLLKDFTEKDAVAWWSPQSGWNRIRESFSKKMTRIYYAYLEKYGIKTD